VSPESLVPFNNLAHWATTNVEVAAFYVLAFLAIPLAYGVLFDHRIIRCGFLLIGVFGAISGLFMLLQAQFLAMAQLMIYAVGITLVVVIALMLTNPRLEEETSPSVPTHRMPGILVAIIVFFTIYLGLRSEPWSVHAVATSATAPTGDNVMRMGVSLLTYYSLPFEFASVLLLIALVGAIMLAKHEPNQVARAETWIEENDDQYDRKEADVAKV
jgi:NAD(P)H-quinone oxidoreductase subunit 6